MFFLLALQKLLVPGMSMEALIVMSSLTRLGDCAPERVELQLHGDEDILEVCSLVTDARVREHFIFSGRKFALPHRSRTVDGVPCACLAGMGSGRGSCML